MSIRRWPLLGLLLAVPAIVALAQNELPPGQPAQNPRQPTQPGQNPGAGAQAQDAGQAEANFAKIISYAIGRSLGQETKLAGVTIDLQSLQAGMNDEVKGAPSPYDDQQLGAAMQQFSQRIQQNVARNNKQQGEAFLAKNGKAEGVVTTATGLQYKVLQEGDGASPKATDTVVCHYQGTFLNGEVFDSSYDSGQPATFPVQGVIPGWTEALQLMKIGSKYQLFVPSQLAYGAQGRPGIPPNATLVFEVELIQIAPAGAGRLQPRQ